MCRFVGARGYLGSSDHLLSMGKARTPASKSEAPTGSCEAPVLLAYKWHIGMMSPSVPRFTGGSSSLQRTQQRESTSAGMDQQPGSYSERHGILYVVAPQIINLRSSRK